LSWNKIKHVIVIPNYNESVEIIAATLERLTKQKNISKEQLVIALAMEGRAEGSDKRAQELLKRFKGKFGRLEAIMHPDGIVGEIRGKAANEAWAAKKIKNILVDKEGLDINNITITSCDADARINPGYFSALTYNFTTDKNRYLRFWQSPICWHNNFWKVPAFIRIIGTLSNVGYLANIQEPDGLF